MCCTRGQCCSTCLSSCTSPQPQRRWSRGMRAQRPVSMRIHRLFIMRSPTRYLIVPVNMALYTSAPYYEVPHQIPYCSSQYGPVYISSLLWGPPPDTLLFQSIWPCIHRLLIMRSPTRYLIVPVNMALYTSAPYYEVTHQIPYCSSQYGPVYIGSLLWGVPLDTLLFQSIWPCIHRLLIMRCPTRYLIVPVNMALYTSAPYYEVSH